jgi:hypothetical protein
MIAVLCVGRKAGKGSMTVEVGFDGTFLGTKLQRVVA